MVCRSFFAVAMLFFCSIAVVSVNAQKLILDDDGVWKGLFNANPDPDGEPWIAGGLSPMTAEQQAEYDALEPFTVPEQMRGRSLPKTVDHTKNPAFRPIFNQQGGSCGQASGTGYHFTFERNQLWGLRGIELSNQCSPGFTWNFVNGGSDVGSWPSAGYNIIKYMGAVHIADFGGTAVNVNGHADYKKFAWCDGYDAYYRGVDAKITGQKSFTKTDIAGLKNWFYDKGTGTGKNGGCVTFASGISFTSITTIPNGPYKGEKLAGALASGSLHAMTLAGYCDELSYDRNGDGKITNDVDLTRDGVVDYQDYESGAWLLVNSWGPSFNNQGKVWVSYAGFGGATILGVTAEKVVPTLMMKVKVTSSARNGIVIKAGYATDIGATAPTGAATGFGGFNKQGGSYPMCGVGLNATLTAGFNISDLLKQLPNGKGKIFLQITGSGTVNEMSVIDYSSGTPKEFRSEQTNVAISGTTNVGVAINIATATTERVEPVSAASVSVTRVGNAYRLVLPAQDVYNVTVRNASGKLIDQFVTNRESQISFGAGLPSGLHIVTVASKSTVLTRKFNVVR